MGQGEFFFHLFLHPAAWDVDTVGFNMNCADNSNMQGMEENKVGGA